MKLVQGQQQAEAWVDRKEMARQLGWSLRTLDRAVAANEVPSCLFGRRTRRFKASEVFRQLAVSEPAQLNRRAA